MFYRMFPHSFLVGGLIMVGILLFVPAETVKAETINVSADGTTVMSSVLLSGQKYELKVEGTYKYGFNPTAFADGEWSYDSTNLIWIESMPGMPTANQDLVINNTEFDWLGRSNTGDPFTAHTFSPDHVYVIPWLGQNEPLAFNIYDVYTGDNDGFLTVNITPVPEPASLSLLVLGGLTLLRRRKA